MHAWRPFSIRWKVVKLTLFSCWASSALAQKPLLVIDSTSGQGIAYATIKYINSPGGSICDSLGRTSIHEKIDSLEVTAAGYEGKRVLASLQVTTIQLHRHQYAMPLIIVSSGPTYTPMLVGNGVGLVSKSGKGLALSRKDSLQMHFLVYGDEVTEIITVPTDFALYQIKTVSLPFWGRPYGHRFAITLYDVDSFGVPGRQIFRKAFLSSSRNFKRGLVSLDLTADSMILESQKFAVSLMAIDSFPNGFANNTYLRVRNEELNPVYWRFVKFPTYKWLKPYYLANAKLDSFSTGFVVEIVRVRSAPKQN